MAVVGVTDVAKSSWLMTSRGEPRRAGMKGPEAGDAPLQVKMELL